MIRQIFQVKRKFGRRIVGMGVLFIPTVWRMCTRADKKSNSLIRIPGTLFQTGVTAFPLYEFVSQLEYQRQIGALHSFNRNIRSRRIC
ncbi:hypothetical protein HOLleu_06659 [Holothuria leucospilota]|uniref:Uncharacterized protein n=1 Tax=Holothuria leucospilota TaxID=206669 RepID=A0A9Q1CLK5_HOLLE|nr:hypothetical protein HOLleu_06659 [Holothuria leucospilota]